MLWRHKKKANIEAVDLVGKHPTAQVKKKKTFEFNESIESWINEASQEKWARIWSELKRKERVKLLQELELDATEINNLVELDFKELPAPLRLSLTELNMNDTLGVLKSVVGVSMLAFAYTVLTNEQPKQDDLAKIEPKKIDIPRYRAFTHSSSFVGNVRYDRDMQRMTAILSGKEYTFCNVPERKFDAFEGANSKGAYFNRNIRTLHDC